MKRLLRSPMLFLDLMMSWGMSPFGMQQLAAMAQGVTISFACCLEVLKICFFYWKGVPPPSAMFEKCCKITNNYQIKWEICDDKPHTCDGFGLPMPPRMPFNMQMPYMGGLAQIISDGNRTEKAAFGWHKDCMTVIYCNDCNGGEDTKKK